MTDDLEILSRRDIQRYLARPHRVVWCWLWLTGGSSADGRTIYLDTSLRDRPQLARRVIYHERVEAALRHCLGWRYLKAHRVATRAENAKYGPEPILLRTIVNRNLKNRSHSVPKGFDPQLAKEAAAGDTP